MGGEAKDESVDQGVVVVAVGRGGNVHFWGVLLHLPQEEVVLEVNQE